MIDSDLLMEALHYASQKHRNQRRKDDAATPYINHPIQVAYTVWKIGGIREEAILCAALLHDTIEDTDATAEEIEALFGKEILGYVLELTDDKSLPKAERKRLQIEHALHKSTAAKQVKMADKSCNVYDISHTPPAAWSKERQLQYLEWAKNVVSGLRGANPALEAHFDKIYAEGLARIQAR